MTGARIELWCQDADKVGHLITYTVACELPLESSFASRACDRLVALHQDDGLVVKQSRIVPLPFGVTNVRAH